MDAEEILARLVGFASVAGRPNGALVDWVADYLEGLGARVAVLPGPEGDRSNLFASFGPGERPGYILSGHLDVVPAEEPGWRGDPFVLRRDGDRLIGRGAVDMKGFVAAVLAGVADLDTGALSAPLHVALSYDEEAGCRGVPHLLAALGGLCAPPAGAIIGEPTGLAPVLRHKGKAALRLAATGVAGHSSRPDLGANAIHALLPALGAAVAEAARLAAEGPFDAAFAPPYHTLQVGTVRGGEALNILPEAAEAQIEARVLPGADPLEVLAPVRDAAAVAGVAVKVLAAYPALGLDPGHSLAALAERLSGRAPAAAVSFGTEAGLFQQAGVPAVVSGPGDIARAHKPEEYITRAELAEAEAMVRRLARMLAGAGVPAQA
ncbi:acetylornithine deacetylase [Roseivivax sp. CAU 1761]